MLGELEYLLITAAVRLGDDAYGAAIRRLLADAGRNTSIGALYTTLDRLEHKSLVRTWMGEATAERGGRAKRMVAVTKDGVQAASSFYASIAHVSRTVSWASK